MKTTTCFPFLFLFLFSICAHHPLIIAENKNKILLAPQHNQQVEANTLLCYPIMNFHIINQFNNYKPIKEKWKLNHLFWGWQAQEYNL